MTIETANASWHPAFMPNAASGDVSAEAAAASIANLDEQPSVAPAEHTSEDADSRLRSHQISSAKAKLEGENNHWRVEDAGLDASDDWPVFDKPVGDSTVQPKDKPQEALPDAGTPELELASAPAGQETAFEDDTVVDGAKSTGPKLGHISNDSFTRTVAHEVNWDDDHDAEWTLSRTDTDPFKFMPPNDRTNSFPPVPPVETSTSASGEELPLLSNQAEDLMSDMANTSFQDSTGNKVTNNRATGFTDDAEVDQHCVGRDVTFSEQEDLGSRYEQGVPLISQSETNVEGSGLGQALDGFVDEVVGDDDFFNQIQTSNGDDIMNFDGKQPLERKSTMQVLGAFTKSISSKTEPLNDMLEEDEDEDEGAQETIQSTEGLNMPSAEPDTQDSTQRHITLAEDTEGKPADDLAAKWEQAFADDEDGFLSDETPDESGEGKPVDHSAFFGSDDEGFLEDDDAPDATTPAPSPAKTQFSGVQGRYMPQASTAVSQRSTSSPYAPAYQPQTAASPFPPSAPYAGQRADSAAPLPGQQQLRPEPPKVQSFAVQSKGGYMSPYDLPMEVVVPKKRSTAQQAPRSPSTSPALAPPRSSSIHAATPPPPRAASSSASPPTSSPAQQPTAGAKPPRALRNKGSFFEDLPIKSKSRTASRKTHRIPSPVQSNPPAPLGPPPQSRLAPSPLSPPMVSPDTTDMSRSASGGIPNLVLGERPNPYAPQQQAPGVPSNSRYSPAPPGAANGVTRPTSSNRYSPAPTGARPSGPAFHSATASPTVLPHLPRTSSPLAHFEVSRGDTGAVNGDQADRRSSYSLEPRIHRVPSLPVTREVDEEDDFKATQLGHPGIGVSPESRYSPAPPMSARQTPPPLAHGPPMHSTFSPSKRSTSAYLPQAASHDSPHDNRFVPPPRSQTQSPGSLHGRPPSQPVARPSSVHSPTSPRAARSFQPSHTSVSRPRGPSQSLNFVVPTDGRQDDPLHRWKGAPIISWGVGGTFITSFPKNVPRYGIGQTAPMIIRSPGEVHVKHVKDIQPLEERLAKFPGPLKGKSKKKETIAWLSSGIEALERDLPDMSFQTQLSHEHKRAVERVLLWKVLRVFIEFDGVLEGTIAVDKAVRDVLAPNLALEEGEPTPGYGAAISAEALQESSVTQMKADAVDSSTMDQIRKQLLVGDREKAVWAAVDKRLWGHAMLISHTVSTDLYQRVAQEFVRTEVNYAGHNNESMAALYKVLSGNYDDCVDELVPAHARAGFQLVNTSSVTGPSKHATEGLDKWRETLGLVLSNRSTNDVRALNALGNLLSSYGRAEAAHICFLFARTATVFGGLDDTASNFVLVGADHKTQGEQFAKETEALLLSEVYEFGLSLSGSPSLSAGVPHLAAYKLQHAMNLAEYGLRDKALLYCEAIAGSITAQTKRSPYYHPILETAVENLRVRLKQAPKEESSSWISKPSMNKVSDTVWSRFNKFVAGDEDDIAAAGGSAECGVESGPFARLAVDTPTISRSPSVTNFEPLYQGATPGLAVGSPPAAVPIPATRAASRYAPVSSQTPALSSSYEPGGGYSPAPASVGRSSNELSRSLYESNAGYIPAPASVGRSSNEFSRSPYESGSYMPAATSAGRASNEISRSPYEQRTSMDSQPGYPNGGYVPSTSSLGQDASMSVQMGAGSISPAEPSTLLSVEVETQNTTQESNDSSKSGYQPHSFSYEPLSMVPSEEPESQPRDGSVSGGYEPPTYEPHSYEPPSYNPEADDELTEPKRKPKSFMDDDDDDIPGLKALKPQEKSKTERDKENEELFRKAAEEDAKRAAAAQQQKKGWGFSSWFGGGKKETTPDAVQPNKPIKAKLGEANNFVYDPDLKRWINKAAGAEQTQAKSATPPPPRAGSQSNTGTPPPPRVMTPPMGRASEHTGASQVPDLSKAPSQESLGSAPPGTLPPSMVRSISNTSTAGGPPSAPPSRPATSLSNASSIDDLLGAGPRKPGAKKSKKGGRYVDVMAK